jgi:hypothetical protein
MNELWLYEQLSQGPDDALYKTGDPLKRMSCNTKAFAFSRSSLME